MNRRSRLFRTSLSILFAAAALAATRHTILDARISQLLAQYPAVQRGHIGYKFVEVTSGRVLAEQDSTRFFTPASNTKLYTTATALVRLGPGYTFKTELTTSGPWTAGQTTLRDLQIIGGGDPNLSGRILPYDVKAKPGDAMAPLRELAKMLADAGVREVAGDVTGVATRYSGDPYPDGWTMDDSIYDYGAPVSALTFNDNAITMKLTPSEIGELPEVATTPVNSPLLFLNEVITQPGRETHVHVAREPGSNEIVLTGTIGAQASPWQQDLAVLDPAQWAAAALIDALRDCGVEVKGEARSQFDGPAVVPGTVLAVHESAPLSQTLTVVNKVSQNLHAEMFLREVGFVMQGSGTLRAGQEERTKFLQELGITPDVTGFVLQDGSGLARQDLTTPDSTVALLRAMWQRPEKDAWLASLPIGGVDGSLEHRFKGIRGAEWIHAKTGSLSHINALSGYIDARQHGWVAFSVMVNATADHQADVRTFIDRLCSMFLSI